MPCLWENNAIAHHDSSCYIAICQVAKNHPFVKGKTLDEWAVSWVETGSSVGPVWRFYRQLWACRNAFAAEIQCIADNSYVDETDRQLAMLAAYNCSPFVLLEYGGLCTEMDSHAHRLAHWLIGSHTCASTARNIASMENVQRAVRLCSREKMASMVSKFDDHWLYERQVRLCIVLYWFPCSDSLKVVTSNANKQHFSCNDDRLNVAARFLCSQQQRFCLLKNHRLEHPCQPKHACCWSNVGRKRCSGPMFFFFFQNPCQSNCEWRI